MRPMTVSDVADSPKIHSTQKHRLILAAIVLLGLVARVGWDLRQSSSIAAIENLPDQREYLELAQHLLSGQGYWLADPRFGDLVRAYRAPGYPLFLAACAAKPMLARLAQAVLDASLPLAIYWLARRWLSPAASLIAATLVAFDPFLVFFSGLLLSETLFTVLLVWGVVLLVCSGGPWPAGVGNLIKWLLGVGLLALAILVRPGAIALPVLLVAAAAVVNRDDPAAYRFRWQMPAAAFALLICTAVLLPWAARNRLVLGQWVWTTTNLGITRYDGFNPDATGRSDQQFVLAMPWTRDMSEISRCNYFDELADSWGANHRLASVQLGVVKIARTWSPVPLSGEYGSRGAYVFVGLLFSGALDLLTLTGILSRRLPAPARLMLVLPALYFTVAAALSVGSLRYRIPAEPLLAIIAAAGAVKFGEALQKRKQWRSMPDGKEVDPTSPPQGLQKRTFYAGKSGSSV